MNTGQGSEKRDQESYPKNRRSYMTVLVTLHNANPWDNHFTLEDVRDQIQRLYCSVECEGISFVVDDIRDEPPF